MIFMAKHFADWRAIVGWLTLAFSFFSTSSAATFSSGTHEVNSNVNGILATGTGTIITVEDPANISQLVGSPGVTSLIAEDGAHVIINGGTFPSGIAINASFGVPLPTVDIYGGTFEGEIGSGGILNIYGGSFQNGTIIGGTPVGVTAEINVYGGTNFGRIGFDSNQDVQVNIYGRQFDFVGDYMSDVYNAYPDAQFPLDEPGEIFSMRDGDCCILHNALVHGEFLDGSPISFQPLLDGPLGSARVNLIVVPEPKTIEFLVFFGLASTLLLKTKRDTHKPS